uniref:Fe2OG dioxygenase domain-containing protein n=1 Tax=Emiliania huxleyi TaxID=2903 RepID=A0A6U8J1T4_EMIHU
MGPYDAVRILRTVLASYAVVARGMRCTTGGARQEVHGDGGVRPIHLVVVAVSLHRVGAHLATRPEEARRLAEIAVAAARDYLVEFRAVRRLILSLDSAAALPAAARQRLLCTVEPPLSSPSPAGGADGFLARTGEAGTQQHAELARLVGALLRHGYAVSEAPVLGDALLAAAEEEARLLQAAGRMQPSTIKRAGSGAARHRDAAARGDVVQWLDGTDGSAPACAALTQWLRGTLLEAVRGACAECPPGANPAAGTAPKLLLEPATSLPLAMLACYPGGGARFQRHVDNSPEAADTRAVTAVLYLNGGWTPSHGGALRVYGDLGKGDAVEVEPRRGTLVLFWAHRVPHEVMPASEPRYALSLWISTAPNQPPGWLERRGFAS